MRNLSCLWIAAMLILPGLSHSFAQKVLLTLPQGEQILYAESSLSMFDAKGGLQVCTSNNKGEYFVYKNDKKLGPFSDLQKATYLVDFPETPYENEGTEAPANEAYNDNYVTWDENGGNYIVLNGKKWGPFAQVKDLYCTANKQHFVAVTIAPQTDYSKPPQYSLITSQGKNIAIKGEPYDLKVNSDISLAVLVSKFEQGAEVDLDAMEQYSQEMEKILAEMGDDPDMEQLTVMSKKMEELGRQYDEQAIEYYVYTSGGKEWGPYKRVIAGENNPDFCAPDSKDWYFIADGFLYKNGSKTAAVSDSDIQQMWWADKAQSFAYSTYDKLVFSTGETYAYPIEIKQVIVDGKTTLKWLVLENENKFVQYSKTL